MGPADLGRKDVMGASLAYPVLRTLPRMASARAAPVALMLAVGLALAGWTPSGVPAVVRAECGVLNVMGSLGTIDDTVYFYALDQGAKGPWRRFGLWRTAGTPRSTKHLKDVRSGTGLYEGTVIGERLYFTAQGPRGPELWRTEGTPGSTTRVRIFGGQGSDNWDVGPAGLAVVGDTLIFTAWGPEHGMELWRSDGTPEGTTILKDIRPGPEGSGQRWAVRTPVGDALYFTAWDGEHAGLWRSDGTTDGTTLVWELPGGLWFTGDSSTVDGSLLFLLWDEAEGRMELWRSDGTTHGTTLVQDGLPDTDGWLTVVGHVVFWISAFSTEEDDLASSELWRSDGTPEGTGRVWSGAGLYGLTVVGETLYFTGDDGEHGSELWRSDGTREGTILVEDIRPGSKGSWPTYLTVVGETLYFSANDGEHGRELWHSGGTPAGTTLVADIRAGVQGSAPRDGTVVDGTLFFGAGDGRHGPEIWRSDGTAEGTRIVRDTRPGRKGWAVGGTSSPPDLMAVGETLYFISSRSCVEHELWRSDGTRKGTFPLLATNERGVRER